MPTITVQRETPLRRSFRVEQAAGMLDVPLEERLGHSLTAEVPGLEEAWTIGAIVGPSGSGKTTLARAAFGEAMWEAQEWPRGRAIVDCLGVVSGAGVSRAGERGGRPEARPTAGKDGTRSVPTTFASIKDIARVLTAVGLGSVPTWLKPYEVLSAGERFRADLARAVLERGRGLTQRRGGAEETGRGGDKETGREGGEWIGESGVPSTEYSVLRTGSLRRGLLVFDEFTSSLDRVVAKTSSAALARMLRRAECSLRFVAVTCHTDILPWLAPDWVVDLGEPSGPQLTRERWKQPEIALRIERVPQSMWARFAPHHYLAGGLAASATCYGAWWEEGQVVGTLRVPSEFNGTRSVPTTIQPVAFCAVAAALGWKKTKRITRLVVLPEFQGLGIGMLVAQEVASRERARGNRVTITASHPAVVGHCSESPQWRYLGMKKNGSTRQRMKGREIRCSSGRAVAGFEFVGGAEGTEAGASG